MICTGFLSRIPIWTECIGSVPTRNPYQSGTPSIPQSTILLETSSTGGLWHWVLFHIILLKQANPLMFVEFESLLCSWNPGNVWWWKIKEFRTAVLCSAGPTRQRSGLELWRVAEVLYPAFVGDARHAVHHQQGGTEETWWPGLGFGFWNIWKGTPLEAPRSSKWMEKITNLSDTKWPFKWPILVIHLGGLESSWWRISSASVFLS